MQSDLQRKALRIIVNYTRKYGRPPTIRELMTKTGRNEAGIRAVLKALAEERYIEWSGEQPGRIKLVNSG
ncbi:LexA family protein [Ferviditalea candida]|uniref:LexA repressor DNA-binding domain-containing protein n=1 Tax=Ferviditalea candida TaxID=3108399 RepID=A0ABU5ZFD3_9BACL|nr:hypothetical protein [Paenibacillaceae bacterium T2]